MNGFMHGAFIILLILGSQAYGWAPEPGDFIVKFKTGRAGFNFQNVGRFTQGGGSIEDLDNNMFRVKVAPSMAFQKNSQEILAELKSNPDIEYAQPNFLLGLLEDY